MCIVLCSIGYPDEYKKNIKIKNISKLQKSKDNFLFHAGTTIKEKNIYSNGGRVLNFVCIDLDLLEARKKIIDRLKELDWEDGFFRKDIGHKAIKNK